MKYLVLGLGNDLVGDDSIGLLAARRIADMYSDVAEVIESDLSGLAMIDLMVGFQKAIIIDAMYTGVYSPGTILELEPESLRYTPSPSPHYSGLPEMIAVAQKLELEFPSDIRILAIEVENVHTVGGALSEPVSKCLPEVVNKVGAILHGWKQDA